MEEVVRGSSSQSVLCTFAHVFCRVVASSVVAWFYTPYICFASDPLNIVCLANVPADETKEWRPCLVLTFHGMHILRVQTWTFFWHGVRCLSEVGACQPLSIW